MRCFIALSSANTIVPLGIWYSNTMIVRHEYRGGVWIDLEQPTEDEIQQIAHEFSINERIETELLSPTPTPLVIRDDSHTLLVLHFPAQNTKNDEAENQEIDFLIGKHFIVTARYEVIVPLHRLKKIFETRDLVAGRESVTTDILLEILFAHLYASVRDYTNNIANRLEHIERDMFDGHERRTVRAISSISREFLHLEAAIANQEEPLNRFLQALTQHGFFDVSFSERKERILAERVQVMQFVKTHRAVAIEMRETNAALLEASQNEIMKMLTIITVIVLPLELIAFIFGMHARGTPLEGNPNAFFIIMGLMLAAVTLMTVYFARKRWIF